MTVKCGSADDPRIKTKHECTNGGSEVWPCEIDQVKVHIQFFEATPYLHQYYINTHYNLDENIPERTFYYKDKNYNDVAGWVHRLPIETANYNIVGDTWIIEEVKCEQEVCPYFIRASKQKTRGISRRYKRFNYINFKAGSEITGKVLKSELIRSRKITLISCGGLLLSIDQFNLLQ